MCHFLPVYHLGIAFLGWVEGQNITKVLILLFTFFQFYSVVSWDSKVHNFTSSLFFFFFFFFFCWLLLGLAVWLRLGACKFFKSALAGGFSLEAEWQQISSGFQDFSLYSGRSQQYCSLDDIDSSSDFHLFQSSYHSFWRPFQVYKSQ